MPMPQEVIEKAAEATPIEMPPIAEGIGDGDELVETADDEADESEIAPDGLSGYPTDLGPQALQDEKPAPAIDSPEPTDQEPAEVDRLATLAEAEADIRRQKAVLKKHGEELTTARTQLETQQEQIGDLTTKLRTDPFGTLEAAGMPFDSLMDAVVKNEGKIPTIGPTAKPTEDDMPAWAKRLEEKVDKAAAEKTAAENQETYQKNENIYREHIDTTLADEKFSLLKDTMAGAKEAIFDLAYRHATETGEVLQPAVIAATLDKEWRETIQSLPNHAHARELLGLQPLPKGQKPKPSKKKPAGSQPETSTLTSLSGDLGPTSKPKPNPKTREEALRLAAKGLEGNDLWGDLGEDEDED